MEIAKYIAQDLKELYKNTPEGRQGILKAIELIEHKYINKKTFCSECVSKCSSCKFY